MITEDKINRNYIIWIDSLKKYNCYSDKLIELYGESIKSASFAMNESAGCAYVGSLLDTVLFKLCTIATHINESAFGGEETKLHQSLNVKQERLMKVLLLQHISKAVMFTQTTEAWKNKRGIMYDFNPDLQTSLKLGERSLFMCSECGITFTEEEYDAMRILDKEDDKMNSYITPLAALVKAANQFTFVECYRNA